MKKKKTQPWRLSQKPVQEKESDGTVNTESAGVKNKSVSKKRSEKGKGRSYTGLRKTYRIPTGFFSTPYRRRFLLYGAGFIIMLVLILLFSIFMCDCDREETGTVLKEKKPVIEKETKNVPEKKAERKPPKKNMDETKTSTIEQSPVEEYTGPPDLGTDIEIVTDDEEEKQ